MTHKPVVILAAMLLVACESPTQPSVPAAGAPRGAATNTSQVYTLSLAGRSVTGYGDCTTEPLVFTGGTVTERISKTKLPGGGYREQLSDIYQGVTVVSASGVTYHYQGTYKAMTYSYFDRIQLIGQGGAPNYLIEAHYHSTFDANGDLTAWVADGYTAKCG